MPSWFISIAAAAVIAGASMALAGAANAADGVTARAVVFGEVAGFKGPGAARGIGVREGIEAAFAEVNGKGGVHGRKLWLVSRDDGADRSIAATRQLIGHDKVFALIGPVGTAAAKAAQAIAAAAGVPVIGPVTGAGFLRDRKLANVVNVRARDDEETEALIAHLTKDLDIGKIAILYRDDAFGRAGLAGVRAAMNKRGLTLAAQAAYRHGTTAVKTALLDIRRADPRAVVMVGTAKPCAAFVRLARKIGFDPVFAATSGVGAAAFARALGRDGKGVIVSQVVPLPWDASRKVVADYRAATRAINPAAQPDFVSLEGYLVGRLAVAGLERAGANPTREGLIEAIEAPGRFDFGGLTMRFGPDQNQGLHRVFMTVVQVDGSFKAVPPVKTASAH